MYSVQNTKYTSVYSYKNSSSKDVRSLDTKEWENGEPMSLWEEEPSKNNQGESRQSAYDRKQEEEEKGMQALIDRMKAQSQSMEKAFDKKKKNLYDATSDLMAIAFAEKEPSLKAIHSRLLFKARMVKASGAQAEDIKIALTKIKKVIGKVKTKIKKLKKEENIEKKRKNAERAKQQKMEEELRRELALRRKVRKNREQKDIEESQMGMGANDGGSGTNIPISLPASTPTEGIGSSGLLEGERSLESGMLDTGIPVSGEMAGSIDVHL